MEGKGLEEDVERKPVTCCSFLCPEKKAVCSTYFTDSREGGLEAYCPLCQKVHFIAPTGETVSTRNNP